ncbi:MAG: hypothetical protein K9L61_01835 [Candidatus Omnitrophica bacterium]|nr:hypothetical protein [Candidatus Omnitrophota bacterium]
MQNDKQIKKPKGILILSTLVIIFGLLSLANYFTLNPERYIDSLERVGQGKIASEINQDQIKVVNNISLILSAFLLLSGVGLFYQKEMARRAIVYFSIFIILIFILVTITQPASIIFAFPQFLFFSIVVLYFTKKNVKDFFTKDIKINQREK